MQKRERGFQRVRRGGAAIIGTRGRDAGHAFRVVLGCHHGDDVEVCGVVRGAGAVGGGGDREEGGDGVGVFEVDGVWGVGDLEAEEGGGGGFGHCVVDLLFV